MKELCCFPESIRFPKISSHLPKSKKQTCPNCLVQSSFMLFIFQTSGYQPPANRRIARENKESEEREALNHWKETRPGSPSND